MLAGLVLRAGFVHWRPDPAGDTLVYGDIANNILLHHMFGLSGPALHATYIRMPGYPLFLAACFMVFGLAKYTAVAWINVAIDLGTCWLVGDVAASLWGQRAGGAALWLAALCPFTANYCAVALTETPSLFCVALAFSALWRTVDGIDEAKDGAALRWAAVTGAALLWAVTLRPEEGLLSAAVVPAMLWAAWRARRLRAYLPGALAGGIVLLGLLGWGVRNERVMGVFQPLAPKSASDPGEPVADGFNHWFRTWGVEYKSTADVYWNYDGAPIALADVPRRAVNSEAERDDLARVLTAYNQVQTVDPGVEAGFERLAEERNRERPIETRVLVPLEREADMWLRPRTELMPLPLDFWNWRGHRRGSAIAVAYGLGDAALLAAAVLGVWWTRWRMGVVGVAMLAFVGLRCVLLLTLDNAEPRYTLECFPVLLVFAALAVARRSPKNG